MSSRSQPGDIITFYSYKGGTGRTMAMANVACVLAERLSNEKKILVVDWDLEAPGLHRFLPPRLSPQAATNELGLDAGEGLIDLVIALKRELPDANPASEEAAEAAVANAFSRINLAAYFVDTNVPGISILRAGRNDDGAYSSRVNTFNWEQLFQRAPMVYRVLGERLAADFEYVLIDSRTGLTDISGICTQLLPEKLVVVFTPNRQSLSGVRDLIERAIKYRRNSDDLRPLLVYPLPSRIEPSRQDLRELWRFGDRYKNLTGFQPMFEELLASAYGLAQCDLAPYFAEVQIQQTPDYAYGEEIAVRRSDDRFSLGQSYRVFVDRLTSASPPWVEVDASAQVSAPVQRASGPEAPVPAPASMPSDKELETDTGTFQVPVQPPAPTGMRVFLSSASADRDRIAPIVRFLESRGCEVWRDEKVAAGAQFQNAIAEAIDRSDAVIVCWSTTSVLSAGVLEEAGEGLRRGILVPILLDDVGPPLAFRSVQAIDLRRDQDRGMQRLAEAMTRLQQSPAQSSPAPAPVQRRAAAGIAVAVVFAVIALAVYGLSQAQCAQPTGPPKPTDSPLPPVTVPDLIGYNTTAVRDTLNLLGLRVTMVDEKGARSPYLDGVVSAQSLPARTTVTRNTEIELTVITKTVEVPTVVGQSLSEALRLLTKAGLQLGKTETRIVRDAKPDIIIEQTPPAGKRVAAGSEVSVVVARYPRAQGRDAAGHVK